MKKWSLGFLIIWKYVWQIMEDISLRWALYLRYLMSASISGRSTTALQGASLGTCWQDLCKLMQRCNLIWEEKTMFMPVKAMRFISVKTVILAVSPWKQVWNTVPVSPKVIRLIAIRNVSIVIRNCVPSPVQTWMSCHTWRLKYEQSNYEHELCFCKNKFRTNSGIK